jgi:hypothetical protein
LNLSWSEDQSRFDPRRLHKQMQLRDDDRTAATEQRW